MRSKLRHGRNMFLLFLGGTFVAVMAGLPVVVAQTQEVKKPAAAQGASAPTPAPARDHPGFEQADRNKDGKLDQAEFEKGLDILQVRR